MSSKIPNACLGKPNGKLVFPEEFLRLAGNDYKNKQIFPYCPECDEKLVISNASNVSNKTFYRHYPNNAIDENGIESCSLREKKSNRQGWYCSSFDFQRGERIKRAFMQKENLIRAYAFCGILRNQDFKFEEFKEILLLADKKKIWSYSDIHLWAIPYILLTLRDFEHSKGFKFHFVLHKQGNNNYSLTELLSSQSEIQKVFSNNGKLMGLSPNNPFPISEKSYLALLEQNQWKTQNENFNERLYRYIQVAQDKRHSHL